MSIDPRPTLDGLPIPYIAASSDGAWGEDGGQVDLTTIDTIRWSECVTRKLCGMCGDPLSYWIAFLGTETECEERRFINPGLHEECAKDYLEHYKEAGLWVLEGRVGIYLARSYKALTGTRVVKGARKAEVFLKPARAKRIEWVEP